MKCYNCGKESPDGAKFCRFCGAKLEPKPAGKGNGNGIRKTVLFPIVAVAAVVVIASSILIFKTHGTESGSETVESTTAAPEETKETLETEETTPAAETEPITETEPVTETVPTTEATQAPETTNSAAASNAYMDKLAEIKATADATGNPPFGSNAVMYLMLDVDSDGTDEMLVESQATMGENSSYVTSAVYKYDGNTVSCIFSDSMGWESWQSSFWGFYKDSGVLVLHFEHNSSLFYTCYQWNGQTFVEGDTIDVSVDGNDATGEAVLSGMGLGNKTDLLTGWTVYAQ